MQVAPIPASARATALAADGQAARARQELGALLASRHRSPEREAAKALLAGLR